MLGILSDFFIRSKLRMCAATSRPRNYCSVLKVTGQILRRRPSPGASGAAKSRKNNDRRAADLVNSVLVDPQRQ